MNTVTFLRVNSKSARKSNQRQCTLEPMEEITYWDIRRRITKMSVTVIIAIKSLGEIPHTTFVKGSVDSTVFQGFLVKFIEAIDRNS